MIPAINNGICRAKPALLCKPLKPRRNGRGKSLGTRTSVFAFGIMVFANEHLFLSRLFTGDFLLSFNLEGRLKSPHFSLLPHVSLSAYSGKIMSVDSLSPDQYSSRASSASVFSGSATIS
jgi:hypothetical protein